MLPPLAVLGLHCLLHQLYSDEMDGMTGWIYREGKRENSDGGEAHMCLPPISSEVFRQV